MSEAKKRGPAKGTIRRRWTPVVRTCVICDIPFEPPRGSPRKTCSRDCRRELMKRLTTEQKQAQRTLNANRPPTPRKVRQRKTPIVRPCEACGKVFENWTNRRKATCSWKCRSKLLSRYTKLQFQYAREGKPHPTPELQPIETACEVCGKTFTDRTRHSRRTCSAPCTKELRGRDRRVVLHKTCRVCGKPFTVDNYNRKLKTCSKKCLSALLAWIKKRPKPERIIWRTKTCIICGKVRRLTSKQYYHTGKTCSQRCKRERLRQMGLLATPPRRKPKEKLVLSAEEDQGVR